jgi:hypothetical protein
MLSSKTTLSSTGKAPPYRPDTTTASTVLPFVGLLALALSLGSTHPPGDAGTLDHIAALSVDRMAESKIGFTPSSKALCAAEYTAAFRAGALADGRTCDLEVVWGEHVLFTRDYQKHLQQAGFSQGHMQPDSYHVELTQDVLNVSNVPIQLPNAAHLQQAMKWSDSQLRKALVGYGQFLTAINVAHPSSPLAPSAVTDEVWHHHLRHGRSYRIMSRQLGRKHIGHNPFTTDTEKASGPSAYKHTLELIRATGGELDAWVWPRSPDNDQPMDACQRCQSNCNQQCTHRCGHPCQNCNQCNAQ